MNPNPMAESHTIDDALAYQERILQGVSRTFALTIPQLPDRLRTAVGNAYLLCRIADTIEDADSLTIEEKCRYSQFFVQVVAGEASAEKFGRELASKLEVVCGYDRHEKKRGTLEAERDLIFNTSLVVQVTNSLPQTDQTTLLRCVRIMAGGMEEFQEGNFRHGLHDLAHLDAYCYHVAGVVGEMLTDLFCAHSPEVARHRESLSKLAVSFGQGLQMTNILKDIWDDKDRDVCWLPRGLFGQHGFDLKELSHSTVRNQGFDAALGRLIGIALAHLKNALTYALLIPKSEDGVRRFCLWAIGMAVLTLRKINRNRAFTSGNDVKISRRSVYLTIFATRITGWSNFLLRLLFRITASGLPQANIEPEESHA